MTRYVKTTDLQDENKKSPSKAFETVPFLLFAMTSQNLRNSI
jgi:hypothetical protein